MFLHLGGDYNISINDVIFILDINSTFKSKYTKEFFEIHKQDSTIIKITNQEAKSIVISNYKTKGNQLKNKIYYSPISSMTLLKRAEHYRCASLETEVI